MAYNKRPTSILEVGKFGFKNENDIASFWLFMNELTKEPGSFAVDSIDSTKVKVLDEFGMHDAKIQAKAKECNLKKVVYGKGSDKFKTADAGSDKTTLQEVGVLVMLDMLANGQKELDDYAPSKRMSVKADLSDVIEFLHSDSSWHKSCLDSAKAILREFGLSKVKKCRFHHDDKVFNEIRHQGKRLSGLSNHDKWNPSDIYLVESKFQSSKATNIIEYNEYIHGSGDIIGISLKKGEKEALHGAIALNVIAKEFGMSGLKATHSKIDEKFVGSMSKMLSKIKSSKFSKKVYVHADDTNMGNVLSSIQPESVNFFKSIPVSVEFLSLIGDDFESAIKYAILSAMSIPPKACPHFKIEGGKFSQMNTGGKDLDIEIMRIRIKLNGNTDVITDFKMNGKQMKLQLRSKGSLPQFILIKTAENPSDIIPITKLK